MNQSKFSIADVLTLVGALTFGFVCFLGLNFLTLGDTKQSVIWSVVIALIIGGLAFGAKMFKRSKGSFKASFILEVIFLILFLVAGYYFINLFSHYFAVSSQKASIQSDLTANISQAQYMFTSYENYANGRISDYESNLNSVALAKKTNPTAYNSCGFVTNPPTDAKQISQMVQILEYKLFPANYDTIKTVSDTWLSNMQAKISPWKPIGVVEVLKDLESNINSWNAQLHTISTYIAICETPTEGDFNFPLTFENVANRFTETSSPSFLSIVLAIIIYILMLLSYIFSLRNSKNPYDLFSFFGSKVNNVNKGTDVEY